MMTDCPLKMDDGSCGWAKVDMDEVRICSPGRHTIQGCKPAEKPAAGWTLLDASTFYRKTSKPGGDFRYEKVADERKGEKDRRGPQSIYRYQSHDRRKSRGRRKGD